MTRNLLNTINIDVPAAVADETVAFWSAALGAFTAPHEDAAVHDPRERRRADRLVDPDHRAGPASVHFDVHTDDLDAEIDRLVALGATLVDGAVEGPPRSVGRHARPRGQRVLSRRRDQPTPRATGAR